MKKLGRVLSRLCKWLIIAIFVVAAAYFIFSLIVRPSLTRDWSPDQAVLAHADFVGDIVKVSHIRNIKYRSTTDYDIRYYDKTFDLNKLASVWYMVEPFSGFGAGAAHTLVSFCFENYNCVSVSAEIRKEKGESFSAIKGLFRQYEIVYVVADEEDVIKLRSNYRHDKVFLYPVKTTQENMRKLFISMLERNNKLATVPEFYNTLTNTCTTNIVSHVNEIVPGRIPLSLKVLMPAYSDELAYKVGLIGNEVVKEVGKDGRQTQGQSSDKSLVGNERRITLDEMRAKYLINERAERYGDDDEEWSKKIRE